MIKYGSILIIVNLLCNFVLAKSRIRFKKTKKPAPINFHFSTYYTSSLHKMDDIDYSSSSTFSLASSTKIYDKVDARISLSGNKSLQGEKKFLWNDSSLSFSGLLRNYEMYKVSLVGSILIPFSESSKIKKRKTSLTLGPLFVFDLESLGAKDFSLSLAPSGTFYFHSYDTALNGKSNYQYALRMAGGLSYAYSKKLSLSLGGQYSRFYTYEYNSSDRYEIYQKIYYGLFQTTIIEMGHSMGGNPLSANGQENEIELLDSRKSSVYLGLSHQF